MIENTFCKRCGFETDPSKIVSEFCMCEGIGLLSGQHPCNVDGCGEVAMCFFSTGYDGHAAKGYRCLAHQNQPQGPLLSASSGELHSSGS